MGTNYYHRTNICECCERYDETHISKYFTDFEAVVVDLDEAPWGFLVVVGSWQEWKSRLLSGGEIWDEYGNRLPTKEFIDKVELTLPEDRRRHYDFIAKNYPVEISDEPDNYKYWLDPQGFSFSGRPFS